MHSPTILGHTRPPADRMHPVPDRGDLFEFHPRASNPELWRTTVPLIVRQRCGRHKGLIATWTAIHWLIVLYAASGRRAFGMREIAQEAGVGRNELAGPNGHIQRLVDLGLLAIVGSKRIPGLREARPVYHIDLADLERQSLELIPELLRERCIPAPPRPTPDPRQTSFLDILPATALPPDPVTAMPQVAHGTMTAAPPRDEALLYQMHQSGTAPLLPLSDRPDTTTALPENGTGMHLNGREVPDYGTVAPAFLPVHARNRDMEGKNEGTIEGVSDSSHARELYQQIAATATQVALSTLREQGLLPHHPATVLAEPSPPAPTGQPPLPGCVVALWQGDRGLISQRDRYQLQMLAAEYDGPTEGAGAYWVGRAILIADRCLREADQPRSINYLRGMLRRWQRENSWGSDREEEGWRGPHAAPTPSRRLRAGAARPLSLEASAPSPPRASVVAAAASVSAPCPASEPPPAITAYTRAFGRAPNEVQARQIGETVTNLALWQRVLTDWQANGWKEGAVAKMLDRYQRDAGVTVPAAAVAAPSVAVIHRYPGLTDQQRDRWIRAFHAAPTPAEKRAVISRLEQEHPR